MPGLDHPPSRPSASVDRSRQSHASCGRPARGLAPILAAQARALAGIMADLDRAARVAGLGSVVDLAATMLRPEFGSNPADSDACEDGMFVAAQALIRRSFGSPYLSPETISRRLGCSRAHLYRLFARRGLTVAGCPREVRLERCRAALAAAAPGEKVADIAFRCGFDNPVHFTRLFRQRFGMRPGEARAATTGT